MKLMYTVILHPSYYNTPQGKHRPRKLEKYVIRSRNKAARGQSSDVTGASGTTYLPTTSDSTRTSFNNTSSSLFAPSTSANTSQSWASPSMALYPCKPRSPPLPVLTLEEKFAHLPVNKTKKKNNDVFRPRKRRKRKRVPPNTWLSVSKTKTQPPSASSTTTSSTHTPIRTEKGRSVAGRESMENDPNRLSAMNHESTPSSRNDVHRPSANGVGYPVKIESLNPNQKISSLSPILNHFENEELDDRLLVECLTTNDWDENNVLLDISQLDEARHETICVDTSESTTNSDFQHQLILEDMKATKDLELINEIISYSDQDSSSCHSPFTDFNTQPNSIITNHFTIEPSPESILSSSSPFPVLSPSNHSSSPPFHLQQQSQEKARSGQNESYKKFPSLPISPPLSSPSTSPPAQPRNPSRGKNIYQLIEESTTLFDWEISD